MLILRDVLGRPAATTADALELSVASTTSALERARVTTREQLPDRRLDRRVPATHELSDDERATVRAWVDAHERNDLLSLVREDLQSATPPDSGVRVTAESAMGSWVSVGFGGPGYDDRRCLGTTVDRMPAVVEHLRTPDHPAHRLFAVDVLHIVDGKATELTGFSAADEPWLPPML